MIKHLNKSLNGGSKMSVNREIFLKVVEALQDQETVDRINQSSGLDEAYEIACKSIDVISKEDFILAIREIKESEGRIVLSDEELDVVAGGKAAGKGEFTVGVKWTF